MEKSILLSIKPKYCELIASGKKTIEVRKTKPKINTPFKCYIYETKSDGGSGKVIGEFICDEIIDVDCDSIAPFDKKSGAYIDRQCCLTRNELFAYTQGLCAFGWHISDLIIYDKPRELSEFRKFGAFNYDDWLYGLSENSYEKYLLRFITRKPPQSWCYVNEK